MTDTIAPPAAPAPLVPRGFPWWVALIQGIAALGIGVLLMMQPAVTTVVLVVFLGWYWLISGIFGIGSLFVDRTMWGWRLASGLLSIIAGAYIIASPLLGAAVVVGTATLLLGINGMIIGVVDLVKAFKGGGWGVGFLGLLSFVIGLAITANFEKYMLVLPWVWGAFAIVAGIIGIVGSFQLKKAQA